MSTRSRYQWRCVSRRQPQLVGWRRLGDILLEQGGISVLQLQTALLEQARNSGRLGEILLARGWISPSELMMALAEQQGINLSAEGFERTASTTAQVRAGLAFGRLLVERGWIDEEQLEQALEEQSRTGLRLGEILHESGAVSAEQLVEAIAEQRGKQGGSVLWQRAQSDMIRSLSPSSDEEDSRPDEWFELRTYEAGASHRLYASTEFVDTSELALAVLDEWTPLTLQIVRVVRLAGDEVCWTYPAN